MWMLLSAVEHDGLKARQTPVIVLTERGLGPQRCLRDIVISLEKRVEYSRDHCNVNCIIKQHVQSVHRLWCLSGRLVLNLWFT